MAHMRPRAAEPGRPPRKTIDQRFDEVSAAFADHRDFTIFCFDKLRTEMVGRFNDVDQRFDGVDQRFDGVGHEDRDR